MDTEKKIFTSARKIFLLYGFYGTTIQKIAADAKVSKVTIHYYFRSKKKLYQRIIDDVAEIILKNHILKPQHYDIILFIINEMRNNKILFISSLNDLVKINWDIKINKLITITITETSLKETMSLLM